MSTKSRAIRLATASSFKQVKGAGVSHRCIHAAYVACSKLTWNGTMLKSPQKTIALLAGYSIRQTILAINWLKRNGYLWVKHNYIKDADGRPRRGISTMSLRKLFAVFSKPSPISAETAPLLLINKDTGEITGGNYTIKPDTWIADYKNGLNTSNGM